MENRSLLNYDKHALSFLQDYLNDLETVTVSTSGSTGMPKLIELDKNKMRASAKSTLAHFELKPKNTILLCLPSQFIAGKMIWVRALEGDLEVVVAPPAANPIKHLNRTISFAAMTPHQVTTCLAENPEKMDWIEKLIIGGGAVSSALLKQLQEIKTACYATYGMTETITHVATQKLNGQDTNSTFQAVGETTFQIGSQQNLIISAPHLSDELITTNDIVDLHDSKHFKWLGRLDFVVNSGGVKLHPEQIEKKLEPFVSKNYFVWKEADEILGEKLILIIEGDQQDLPSFETVLDKLERPKHVYFTDAFVFTPTGKLDRKNSYEKAVRT
jgi:O-succinylbenzoic acid--CoA ligase